MKKLLIPSLLFLMASPSWAPPISFSVPFNIEEEDGAPSCFPWKTKVTNGSLTCNADNTASVDTGSGGTPGGSDTQVQFNDSGVFAGVSTFTWTTADGRLNIGAGTTENKSRLYLETGTQSTDTNIIELSHSASVNAPKLSIGWGGSAFSANGTAIATFGWQYQGNTFEWDQGVNKLAQLRRPADGVAAMSIGRAVVDGVTLSIQATAIQIPLRIEANSASVNSFDILDSFDAEIFAIDGFGRIDAPGADFDGSVTISAGGLVDSTPEGSTVTYHMTVGSFTVVELTPGECVQTTTGGRFTTTGSACGAGGGSGGYDHEPSSVTFQFDEGFTASTGTFTHTATQDDEFTLELNVDAAGFADVKALDINYITGALADGEDEAVVLIIIDESGAAGGHVAGFQVIATEGSANIYGMEVGAVVNPILQLSGVFVDHDSFLVAGLDEFAASTSTTENVELFSVDNDTVTIGNATKFEELEFLLGTPASPGGIIPTFEFSDGIDSWVSFTPVDGTNGMRNTGIIIWDDADIPSWAMGLNSEFLIRITRTRNSLSTPPVERKVQIASVVEYMWDKDGDITISTVTFSGDLLSDDGAFSYDDATNQLFVGDTTSDAIPTVIFQGGTTANNSEGDVILIRSRGATSNEYTSIVFEDSIGNVFARITARNGGTDDTLSFWTDSDTTAPRKAMELQQNAGRPTACIGSGCGADGDKTLKVFSASGIGTGETLYVQQGVGQTGDSLQAVNSGGTEIWSVDNSGRIDAPGADFDGSVITTVSLEMPQADVPTLDAIGEFALDTSVPSMFPLVQYATSTTAGTALYMIAVSSEAMHGISDNDIVKYDAALSAFVLEADASGGGGSGTTIWVEEDGSSVDTAVSTMNFVNVGGFDAWVIAQNPSGQVDVSIDTNTVAYLANDQTFTTPIGSTFTFHLTVGSITSNNLTASQFVVTDANKQLASQSGIDTSDVNSGLFGSAVQVSSVAIGSINDTAMANESFGDWVCDSTENGCTLNTGVVAPAEMADADHGDVAWSAGVATVENVAAANVAGGDLGSTVIVSSVAENAVANQQMADDAITSAEMGDSDHGDVSWTSNVATVDNVAAANINGAVAVANGGTGATSLTDGGVLLGSDTSAITAMSVLADGAIIVGDGATDPVALTAFTSSTGDLIHEAGGLEADVSGFSGLLAVSGGATSEVDSKSELEAQIADVADFAEADGDVYAGTHNFGGADDLEIPNGTNPTVDTTGQIAFDTTAGQLLAFDGDITHVVGFSTHSVTVTISSGTGWDSLSIPVWRAPTNMAATITRILAESLPASTTVLYQLDETAFGSMNSAGTDVFSIEFSSANNTGVTTTAFSNPGIAAESSLVFNTPAAGAGAGSPDFMTFTIFYTRNRE